MESSPTLIQYLCSPELEDIDISKATQLFDEACNQESPIDILHDLSGFLEDDTGEEESKKTPLNVKILVVVLLGRLCFTGNRRTLGWSDLSEEHQQQLKVTLLRALHRFDGNKQCFNVARVVAQVGTEIMEAGEEWPELCHYILESEQYQESALLVLSFMPGLRQKPIFLNTWLPKRGVLWKLLSKRLSSPFLRVKILSFKAIISLACLFCHEQEFPKFFDLLKSSFVTIVNDGHFSAAIECASQIVLLARRAPEVLRPHLAFFVQLMGDYVMQPFALEVLAVLAEKDGAGVVSTLLEFLEETLLELPKESNFFGQAWNDYVAGLIALEVVTKAWQGNPDVELNDARRQEADAGGGESPDQLRRCCTSALQRLSQKLNLQGNPDVELNDARRQEADAGGGESPDQLRRRCTSALQRLSQKLNLQGNPDVELNDARRQEADAGGGESPDQLRRRCTSALQRLSQKLKAEKSGGVSSEHSLEQSGGVSSEHGLEKSGGVSSEHGPEKNGGVSSEHGLEKSGGVSSEHGLEKSGGVSSEHGLEKVG